MFRNNPTGVQFEVELAALYLPLQTDRGRRLKLPYVFNYLLLFNYSWQQYCSILMTTVNNMGSASLFNPVHMKVATT